MGRIVHFLSYNNAVPIALAILLLGAASAFAASEEVRDQVYSETEQILTIDNTYLVGKDLSSYTPRVEITGVTEDTDTYYISYNLYTIGLEEGIWKDLVQGATLKVAKAVLGEYTDLGVYATEQLHQVVEYQRSYLREAQEVEGKHVSQKTVATVYGGLIGKMLDVHTETLPGYTPVVTPPPPPVESTQVAAAATPSSGSVSSTPAPADTNDANQYVATINPDGSTDREAPTFQVLGNNPARIPIGARYADLGVIVQDNLSVNLGITYYVDDRKVTMVSIDTTTAGTYKVSYEATDNAGNTGRITRTVEVYDPNPPKPEPIATSTAATTTTAASSTPDTPPAELVVPTQEAATSAPATAPATTATSSATQ